MDDEDVAAIADLSAPVAELPRLVEDPLAAPGRVELGLREPDALSLGRDGPVGGGGGRGRRGEEAPAGRMHEGRLVEVALLGQGRDEVPAVGRVGRDVELEGGEGEEEAGRDTTAWCQPVLRARGRAVQIATPWAWHTTTARGKRSTLTPRVWRTGSMTSQAEVGTGGSCGDRPLKRFLGGGIDGGGA